ncbi:MAG: hypothetical protein K0Q74_1162 [Gammaproteobacteria bacterium]|jgi:uncharacterized protein (DUF924 family)|nr:hypothetical protein [Gammaproteobacteria bacterium]
MEKIEEILHYWFDDIEKTILPSERLEQMWFGDSAAIAKETEDKFSNDFMKALRGDYDNWNETPRGCLAMIILFDQFSRHIYRETGQAFRQDDKALQLCLTGIDRQYDHMLSLIERAFFYAPLMHSENMEMQYLSIRAYEILITLSFPEVRPLFERFLRDAIKYNEIITKFGRFPNRNGRLGRISTPEEEIFLKNELGKTE